MIKLCRFRICVGAGPTALAELAPANRRFCVSWIPHVVSMRHAPCVPAFPDASVAQYETEELN